MVKSILRINVYNFVYKSDHYLSGKELQRILNSFYSQFRRESVQPASEWKEYYPHKLYESQSTPIDGVNIRWHMFVIWMQLATVRTKKINKFWEHLYFLHDINILATDFTRCHFVIDVGFSFISQLIFFLWTELDRKTRWSSTSVSQSVCSPGRLINRMSEV